MGRPRGQYTTQLAKYLTEKGIGDEDMAKALDITPAFVGMLRRGKAGPSLTLANKISIWTMGAVPTSCWGVPCLT